MTYLYFPQIKVELTYVLPQILTHLTLKPSKVHIGHVIFYYCYNASMISDPDPAENSGSGPPGYVIDSTATPQNSRRLETRVDAKLCCMSFARILLLSPDLLSSPACL